MATSNNRDVKMSLSVETLGVEGIDKLKGKLKELAAGGGDAAPEFKRLADEIDRLGEQAGALRNFENLNAEVRDLGEQQAAAAAKVGTLQEALAAATVTTNASRQAHAAATAELKAAQDALAATNGELKILRNSFDESGKRVANYKADLQRLVVQQVEQSAALRDNRDAQKAATKELDNAEDAQSKIETALGRQEKAVRSLNGALETQQATLKDQATALDGFGLASNDLAQSQAKLLLAINATGTASEKLAADLAAVREAERQLDAQNELANQRMQDRILFMQQTAAREDALAKQRIAAAELQAEVERKSAAERKAIADKAAADQIAAAKVAANAIASAFDTAGAKSAADLRNQIDTVRAAMTTLGSQAGLTGRELDVALTAGNAKIKALERDLREATGQMTIADRATKLFSNSLGQIAAGNLIADGVGFLVEKVKALGREFFAANIQAEGMTRALNAVYKNSDVAANQISFLNKAANTAGISVSKITDDFVKFSAATQTSNIPLEQSNALFSALTQASGTLGLGADKVALSLNALGQIASKGVVSMEELRGQLGDALPGALSLTAQGMGITDAALIKLVESGNLASSTFIPAFTSGLKTLSGENDTLQGSLARLSNATNTFFRALGDAGVLQVLKSALSGVTEAAKGTYAVFTLITEGFFSVGRAVGAMTGALVTGQNVFTAATDVFVAMNERLTLFMTTLYGTSEAAVEAQAKLDALNATTKAAAEVSVQAELALVKFNAALIEHRTKLEERTAAAERDVKVSEIMGNNMTTLATLSGSLTAQINTEIEAANRNAVAKEAVVAALEKEIAFYSESLAATELLLSQKTKITEADLKQVDSLKKVLESRTQDVQKAKEQVEASRLVALQSEVEAQKHADNSGRLQELKAAYDGAKEALDLVIAAEKLGYDVSEQKRKVIENLRVAQAYYNDSLNDTSVKLQSKAVLEKADYELQTSALNLLKAKYVAMEANAKALGNEYQLRQARIGQLQVDIDLTKAKVAYMEAEAKSSIAIANAKMAELDASDQLTPLKRAELEASIKLAEAKLLEAKATGTVVTELERQLAALKNGTGGAKEFKSATDGVTTSQGSMANATNAATDALERMNMKYMQSSKYSARQIELLEQEISAQERLAAVKDRAIALENKRRNVDSEGFTLNTAGQRVAAGVQTEASLFNALKAKGLDDATARQKAPELKRLYDTWANGTASSSTMGSFSSGELMKDSWLTKPFEQVIDRTVVDTQSAVGGRSASPSQPSAAKTYNVQIGNRTVRTASDADAQNLIGALKQASLTA